MPPTSRLVSKDEELGKRDDDFRPKKKETMSAHINPLHWRKRRLFLIFAVVIAVYFFVQNIPVLGPADLRLNPAFRPYRPGAYQEALKQAEAKKQETVPEQTVTKPVVKPVNSLLEPTGPPPRDESSEDLVSKQTFDGPIKYYRLATTLNRVSTIARAGENRNVVFAASSLKSLANLLPLACSMAAQERNAVHFVIISRSDLSIEEIKAVNSFDQTSCPVEFHDARPDYTEYSCDGRHEAAVAGAIAHVNAHIGPHAIIIDHESIEDQPFVRAVRRRAKDYFRALIEIPAGKYDEFLYIGYLDHKSLSAWHAPTIDIIIHAQNDSAGSLMRLLRSLGSGSCEGLRLPKLTIDLATTIPQALRNVISSFKWPPRYEPADKNVDTLTLRHHVQPLRMSTEQAALRFLESFYPVNHDHHVLILSPQVELSPQYLQYLHYNILEYKYKSRMSLGTGELLGIALDVPSRDLSGRTAFIAPEIANDDEPDKKTPFLYAAPSATALLIFGDKWQVFHDFLTLRTTAAHLEKAAKTKKLVSEAEPAWMEYLLELMQARGWHILFPGHSYATVHNELAQIPEEFLKESASLPSLPQATRLSAEEPFILAPEMPESKPHVEHKPLNPLTPLHQTLPYQGILPKLDELPYLTHEGDLITMGDVYEMKADYIVDFRKRIGGCTDAEAKRPRIVQDGKADDLFCLPSMNMMFDTAVEAD